LGLDEWTVRNVEILVLRRERRGVMRSEEVCRWRWNGKGLWYLIEDERGRTWKMLGFRI